MKLRTSVMILGSMAFVPAQAEDNVAVSYGKGVQCALIFGAVSVQIHREGGKDVADTAEALTAIYTRYLGWIKDNNPQVPEALWENLAETYGKETSAHWENADAVPSSEAWVNNRMGECFEGAEEVLRTLQDS